VLFLLPTKADVNNSDAPPQQCDRECKCPKVVSSNRFSDKVNQLNWYIGAESATKHDIKASHPRLPLLSNLPAFSSGNGNEGGEKKKKKLV